MATFRCTFIHDGKFSPSKCGGGGARPPPFTLSTIMCKVVAYVPTERADTLLLFLLYPLLLCGNNNTKHSLYSCVYCMLHNVQNLFVQVLTYVV